MKPGGIGLLSGTVPGGKRQEGQTSSCACRRCGVSWELERSIKPQLWPLSLRQADAVKTAALAKLRDGAGRGKDR